MRSRRGRWWRYTYDWGCYEGEVIGWNCYSFRAQRTSKPALSFSGLLVLMSSKKLPHSQSEFTVFQKISQHIAWMIRAQPEVELQNLIVCTFHWGTASMDPTLFTRIFSMHTSPYLFLSVQSANASYQKKGTFLPFVAYGLQVVNLKIITVITRTPRMGQS